MIEYLDDQDWLLHLNDPCSFYAIIACPRPYILALIRCSSSHVVFLGFLWSEFRLDCSRECPTLQCSVEDDIPRQSCIWPRIKNNRITWTYGTDHSVTSGMSDVVNTQEKKVFSTILCCRVLRGSRTMGLNWSLWPHSLKHWSFIKILVFFWHLPDCQHSMKLRSASSD